MRKTSLVVLALLVITASLAFSDEESEVLGTWKGKFASPTYGIALWPGSVYGEDDGYAGDIMLPGIDLGFALVGISLGAMLTPPLISEKGNGWNWTTTTDDGMV